jgi:hypothetical protein
MDNQTPAVAAEEHLLKVGHLGVGVAMVDPGSSLLDIQ